jgi:Putative stress-induced transcription regulator
LGEDNFVESTATWDEESAARLQKMSRFFWVGKRVAVDFTNTDVVADGAPLDLLGTAAELRAWLVQAGLFSGEAVRQPCQRCRLS